MVQETLAKFPNFGEYENLFKKVLIGFPFE
jgi:hypothetical protein